MTFLILSEDRRQGKALAKRLAALEPDVLCVSLPAAIWETALREILVDVIVCPSDSPLLSLASHPYAVPWPAGKPTDKWVRSLLHPETPEVSL